MKTFGTLGTLAARRNTSSWCAACRSGSHHDCAGTVRRKHGLPPLRCTCPHIPSRVRVRRVKENHGQ